MVYAQSTDQACDAGTLHLNYSMGGGASSERGVSVPWCYNSPMRFTFLAVLLVGAFVCSGQQSNLGAQREAMKKLDFLAGKWSRDASVSRGPGEPMKVVQTENIQFKLDGLVLLIEGTSRNADRKAVFQALAVVYYDDSTSVYRFRAYNDGRYLDTELKVIPQGFAWGYEAGPLKVNNSMRLNEKGEWVEVTESTYGATPPRNSVEMVLKRQP